MDLKSSRSVSLGCDEFTDTRMIENVGKIDRDRSRRKLNELRVARPYSPIPPEERVRACAKPGCGKVFLSISTLH